MIEIFTELIKDKKIKIDVDEYILNYSINLLNLKKTMIIIMIYIQK